jgi:hypothetical protein
MWHAWGRVEVFTEFWFVSPKVRDHWEDLGVGGRINIKIDLKEVVGRAGFGPVAGFCEHGNEP